MGRAPSGSFAEARDPERDAPVALFVALAAATLIYSLGQTVVTLTLPNAGASTRPLADSARIFLGAPGAGFLAVCALLSTFGYLAGGMVNVPRLTFAMAEQRDLPRVFRSDLSRRAGRGVPGRLRAALHLRLPRGRDGERPPPDLRDGGAAGPPARIRLGPSALPNAACLDRGIRRSGLGPRGERRVPAEPDALGGGPAHHLRAGLCRAADAPAARWAPGIRAARGVCAARRPGVRGARRARHGRRGDAGEAAGAADHGRRGGDGHGPLAGRGGGGRTATVKRE